MSRIKAVFYDLDNTIYPQITDMEQRINYCIKTYSLPKKIKPFWIKEWLDNGPIKDGLIDVVLEKFSIGISKKKLLSAFRACQTDLCLEKEVRDYLVTIKNRGIKQFLITNGIPKTQLKKIQSLNLREFIDEIIVATGKYSKPSNYWFKKMLVRYRLDPKECLSVGDWYAVDGIASISAAISFLHVKGGPIIEYIPRQVHSITRLTDIESYIKY
jgi:FMN phosphatase YigB (HAD superfamily)